MELVGPNRSGKTTLIKLILGLAKPFTGSDPTVRLEDVVCFPHWARVGYLPRVGRPYSIPISRRRLARSSPWVCCRENDSRVSRSPTRRPSMGFSTCSGLRDSRYPGRWLVRGTAAALSSLPGPSFTSRSFILDEPTAALDPDARDSFFHHLEKSQRSPKHIHYSRRARHWKHRAIPPITCSGSIVSSSSTGDSTISGGKRRRPTCSGRTPSILSATGIRQEPGFGRQASGFRISVRRTSFPNSQSPLQVVRKR